MGESIISPDRVRVGDVLRDASFGEVVVRRIERVRRAGRVESYWFHIDDQPDEDGNLIQTAIGARAGVCSVRRVGKENGGSGG